MLGALKRDFKSISESAGRLGKIGVELDDLATCILRLRARVRDGTLKWQTFVNRMEPMLEEVETLLQEGSLHKGALAGKCRKIFNHRKYLWTFVERADVEPTNNHAEHMVR